MPTPSSARHLRIARLPTGWVPAAARRVEPWCLGAMAMLAAAWTVLAEPQAVWTGALPAAVAAACAWVASRRPARDPSVLAARGALVLAASLAAGAGAATPSEALALQGWGALASVVFAALLRPRWAVALVGLGLLHAMLPGTSSLAWPLALATAGASAVAGGAAWWTRRSALGSDPGRVDPATGLLSRAGLVSFGDELLAALGRRHPAAMVVFDCPDLVEVRTVYGAGVAGALLERLLARLGLLAGRQGLLARTGPTQFAVLLPGQDASQAIAAVHAALGRPSRIEYDAGRSEVVLVPDFAVLALGGEVDDCESLYQALDARLARIRDFEARRQQHLRRSRERYTSSPAPLAAA